MLKKLGIAAVIAVSAGPFALFSACGSSPAEDADQDPLTGQPSGQADDDGNEHPHASGSAGGGGNLLGESELDAGQDGDVPAPPPYAIHVPFTKQVKGDAAKGYDYLINGDYITLGIPFSGYAASMPKVPARDQLPGRTGDNAKVTYMFNVVTDPDGVKVVSPNCLSCHSSYLNGKLVVGLGRASFAVGMGGVASSIAGVVARMKPKDAALALKFTSRIASAALFGPMDVFPVLASHHDPETLEWKEKPVFNGDTKLAGGVDVPPWWRAKKKGGLYYTGVGRGQQGPHMSFMSVFSVRNTKEADKIEENFINVAEYIRSIEPPAFPGPIDDALAATGEQVFLDTCATCHGTYGANETYPNLVIPYQNVGTDPSLATDNWVNQGAIDWFAKSYYAGNGRSWMEQLPGYYAPPLDGIWATAPFFHNGSVPTLEAVIDPDKRPDAWRSNFGDKDYDLEHVGWKVTAFKKGYPMVTGSDSSSPGNSNKGHVYGAVLSDEDQRALLEYLKTL